MNSDRHKSRGIRVAMVILTMSCMIVWQVDLVGSKSRQQENDGAAKQVQRKFKQYKRVHQEILKIIVDGDPPKAIRLLEEILRVVPKDG